jgi:hypothetical protein
VLPPVADVIEREIYGVHGPSTSDCSGA